MTTEMKQDVVRVRPEAETMSRQRLPCFAGISGATAGARALSMNLVIVSDSEPAVAIVARTDPNEQESVEPYDPDEE